MPPTHQLGQIEWPNDTPDPRKDFAVVDFVEYDAEDAYIRAIRKEPSDDVAVFVHGYNSTASEALYRYAQISHDFEITMPRVLFAWPSAGVTTGYVYDRDSALFSRDPLARLLTKLSRETNKDITLMAHSMGAHLTMEVLRQLALTGRRDVLDSLRVVVLLAPDIDPDVFRAQATVIEKLPDPFVIMTNRDDRALRISALLNVGRQKVGDLSRAEDIEGFNIVLFDFTELSDGSNLAHLVPMTSPEAIAVLRELVKSDDRGQLDLSGFEIGDDGVIRARKIEVLDQASN
ncbi:MAG: alpha/beta hydrolase [Roseobacter sp.]